MKGHTIKSNARRAARKEGLDCDALDFAQGDDGLWRWTEKTIVAVKSAGTSEAARLVTVDLGAQGTVSVVTTSLPKVESDDPKVWSRIKSEILPPTSTEGDAAKVVAPEGGSKIDMLVGMLDRATGASVAEIAAFLEWQPHTARGRISDTARKRGLHIITQEVEGRGRVYYVDRADPRQEGLL